MSNINCDSCSENSRDSMERRDMAERRNMMNQRERDMMRQREMMDQRNMMNQRNMMDQQNVRMPRNHMEQRNMTNSRVKLEAGQRMKCDDCSASIDRLQGMPLAMAYVPWQNLECTYEPAQALQAGTIFPELDKPFYGRRGNRA